MIIDLGMALTELRDVINGGSCDRAIMIREINRAQAWVSNKNDWKETLQKYVFCTSNSCLVLPPEIKSVRRARVNGRLIDQHTPWFEYQSNGPGSADGMVDCGSMMVQENDSPVISQPSGNPLMIISDRLEDKTASIVITGKDEKNLDVRSGCCPDQRTGAELPLNTVRILAGGLQKIDVGDERCEARKTNAPLYTREKFTRITNIIKPVTKGYIWVLEYCPAEQAYKTLALLHPNAERSCYSVYRLRPAFNQASSINILAKRQYIPAVADSDVLYIQSMPALYELVQMLYQRRNHNVRLAEAYEGSAEQHLIDQLSDQNRGVSMEQDVDSTWGGGQVPNMR